MNDLFYIFILCNALLLYANARVYECPNYDALNSRHRAPNKKSQEKSRLRCLIDPKKVINRYKSDLENYVQPRPFASVCVKCSMCLAVAKEMDKIFIEFTEDNKKAKQTEAMAVLGENIRDLCSRGFQKLREMCTTFFDHMDIQQLLNDYLRSNQDMSGYLCRSNGIFRDCSSLTSRNVSKDESPVTC